MRDAHTASGLRRCPLPASPHGQSSVPGCCPPKGQGVSSSRPPQAHPPASSAGGTGYGTGPCFSEVSAATASPAAFSSAGWRLPPAPLSARTLPPASWTPGPPSPSCALTRLVHPPGKPVLSPPGPLPPPRDAGVVLREGFCSLCCCSRREASRDGASSGETACRKLGGAFLQAVWHTLMLAFRC